MMTPKKAEHILYAEHRRLHPLGRVAIRRATGDDLDATLQWLREEQDATGHSFYCNAGVIRNAHRDGGAFVARTGDRCVGLLVDGLGGPEIVTVHPAYRRHGIGRRLVAYSIKRAHRRGLADVQAECVTEAGEQLFRAMGFNLASAPVGFLAVLRKGPRK